MRRVVASAVLSLALLVVSGCAFMNRENTRAFNLVEDHLWPEEGAMRAVVFPVVFPVGFVAISLDAFVIHPASVVEDAFLDTRDELWDDFDFDEMYVTEVVSMPWRAAATPIYFAGDVVGRSFFDIPRRAERERKAAERRAEKAAEKATMAEHRRRAATAYAAARAAYDRGDDEAVVAQLAVYHRHLWEFRTDGRPRLAGKAGVLLLRSVHRSGDYAVLFDRRLVRGLVVDPFDGSIRNAVEAMATSPSEPARWFALRLYTDASEHLRSRRLTAAVRRGLGDDAALVRTEALSSIRRRRKMLDAQALAPDVARLAAGDPDPVVRLLAARLERELRAPR